MKKYLIHCPEEEKESDICNETGDAFVVKEVIKKIKDLKGVTQESVVLYDKLVKGLRHY